MRSIFISFLFVTGVIATANIIGAHNANDEEGVGKFIASFEEAFNRHDAESVSALYTDDAEFMVRHFSGFRVNQESDRSPLRRPSSRKPTPRQPSSKVNCEGRTPSDHCQQLPRCSSCNPFLFMLLHCCRGVGGVLLFFCLLLPAFCLGWVTTREGLRASMRSSRPWLPRSRGAVS
jgi:hypothetical protein